MSGISNTLYRTSVTLEKTKDGREQVYLGFSPMGEPRPKIYDYMALAHKNLSRTLKVKKPKEGRRLNDEVIYRATFTLEQTGLDGPVTPKLEFHPLVEDPREAPAIYGYMSHELLKFLRMVNIIDENNEVIEKEYLDGVELHLTDEDNGETRQ